MQSDFSAFFIEVVYFGIMVISLIRSTILSSLLLVSHILKKSLCIYIYPNTVCCIFVYFIETQLLLCANWPGFFKGVYIVSRRDFFVCFLSHLLGTNSIVLCNDIINEINSKNVFS